MPRPRSFATQVALVGVGIAALVPAAGALTLPPTPPVPAPTVPTPTIPVPPAPVPPAPVQPPPLPVQPPPAPAPAPSVPTPTVPAPPAPAPRVPVPRVPAPAPVPPVRAPAPPAAPSAPRTPSPAPVRSPATGSPASQPAPSPGSSNESAGSPAGGGATWSSSGAASAPRSASASRRENAPRPARGERPATKTAKTRKGATLVRLDFALAQAQRLFLIVRGPAPSCRTAGVIRIRGREGFNSIPFAGRLRKEQLEPGVYGLTLSLTRAAPADAQEVFVRVVSKRRTVLVPEGSEPSCEQEGATLQRLLRVLAPVSATSDPGDDGRGGTAAAPAAPLLPPSVPEDENAVVLADLPTPRPALGGGDSGSSLEAVASIAVLVAIGFLLVTMLALVTRFLRGSWNP